MSSPTLIKICGNTTVADAQMAARAGADFLGVIVEHPPSPRSVELAQAQRIRAAVDVPVVAVTVNLALARLLEIHAALAPFALQLHGDEPPQLVRDLKARGVTVWGVAAGAGEALQARAKELLEAGADAILVDARHRTEDGTVYGGTGHAGDWAVARQLVADGARVILAGGLNPDNVAQAVAQVRPWMVDVVSGVEASKGVKDAAKVRAFITAVREFSSADFAD